MIHPEDLERAALRIAPHVHRTPLMHSRSLSALAGCELWLKCENLQRGGAFKIRGASNAIWQLDMATAARGVVAHSSGNHAQGVALAGRDRGIPVDLVIPTNAPAVKRAAAESYGARIHDCDPTWESRVETAQKILDARGGTLIHPFESEAVIAGQATVGREILDEMVDLDTIVAPIGGGGLCGGIALTAHYSGREIQVHGAEPAGADDAARSKAANERLPQTDPRTIADGLRTGIGALSWPLLRDHVEAIHTVADDEILAAMRLLFERCKLVVEPSGAASLAAVLVGKVPGRRIAVVLSGGNVELDPLFHSFRS